MTETSETLDRMTVIVAHPEDPRFGPAGTVPKWTQDGRNVTYVQLTSDGKKATVQAAERGAAWWRSIRDAITSSILTIAQPAGWRLAAAVSFTVFRNHFERCPRRTCTVNRFSYSDFHI
jgi:LmbE family N-acetylglucosaminyl deacetylase